MKTNINILLAILIVGLIAALSTMLYLVRVKKTTATNTEPVITQNNTDDNKTEVKAKVSVVPTEKEPDTITVLPSQASGVTYTPVEFGDDGFPMTQLTMPLFIKLVLKNTSSQQREITITGPESSKYTAKPNALVNITFKTPGDYQLSINNAKNSQLPLKIIQ